MAQIHLVSEIDIMMYQYMYKISKRKKQKVRCLVMYLDPGFGGMLLQVLLAIIVAGGAILFSLRRKIRASFSKKKTENPPVVGTTRNTSETDGDMVDTLSSND